MAAFAAKCPAGFNAVGDGGNVFIAPFLRLMLYDLIGRLFFPRSQDWKQRKNAKILVLTIAFTLVLGLVMAKIFHIIYNHQH